MAPQLVDQLLRDNEVMSTKLPSGEAASFYFMETNPEPSPVNLLYYGFPSYVPLPKTTPRVPDSELVELDASDVVTVLIHFAHIRRVEIFVREKIGNTKRKGPPVLTKAAAITIFAPSLHNLANIARFQDALMRPGLRIDLGLQGVARPFLGNDDDQPKLMSCTECMSMNHYESFCPILQSEKHRLTHDKPAESVAAEPTASLVDSPTPVQATTPRGRGGRGGGRARGWGRARGGRGFQLY
ncbi:hypothetical protein C8F01DRAFT_1091971 [Mycena amicta]|nr:hypothetical protein C8F01DRAFT_1091971 [Mycena amicta]